MTRKRAGVRRQSALFDAKGRRVARSVGSWGFSPELDRAVRDAASEAKCSIRLVVAVAVARFLDVNVEDSI